MISSLKIGAGFIGQVFEIAPHRTTKVRDATFTLRLWEEEWKGYKMILHWNLKVTRESY